MQNDRAALRQIIIKLPDDRTVLSGPDGFSLSGQELRGQIDTIFDALSSLPKGTRVATLLPDTPMTAISLIAMVHHVQVMPINPALSDIEIERLLTSGSAQILLVDKGDLRAQSIGKTCEIPIASVTETGTFTWPDITGKESEAGLILLTSGSTGMPKRVPLTPKQLHLSANRIARALQLGPKDRAVHALPMFHIGAIVDLFLAPLLAGGCVHFAGGMGAQHQRSAVIEHGGTWLQLVPTMLARLQVDLSAAQAYEMGQKLRFIRSVSSDLAPKTQSQAEAFFANTPIIQMYGMTETAGQITTNPLPPETRKLGSVGRAFEVDLRIENGEVQVRGDSVTKGYENGQETDNFTSDQWLRTGDLGRIDRDGFLFLTGRAKEMINRGGEKISPHEIEHAALTYNGVVEAAAFARPHPSLGEEVGLAVTLRKNGNLHELEKGLKTSLAAFKQPRKILVLDPLPRLGSGKIDRRALRSLEQPDANRSDAPPISAIAAQISQAWRAVLQDTSKDGPNANTDFFDAGGDSLAGAQFLFEVERLTGRSLPANLLYEAPEFGAFVQGVENAPLRRIADASDPKHAFLESRLKDWDAPEVPGVPYMRVLHMGAPKAPLFWCAQEEDEYQQLANAFTDERPLYLMRSLFLMLGKNDDMSKALAKDYALAISTLQPEGPIRLGGFCEGAKIMHFAAEHLSALGRDIQVVIAWDQIFEGPNAFPMLYLWSDDRYERYRRVHLFPERAIAPNHLAGFDMVLVGGAHTEVLTQGPIAPFLPKINTALDHGIECNPITAAPVFDRPITGKISPKGPRFHRRGESVSIRFQIRNEGDTPWFASPDDPLFATAQLQNLDGHVRQAVAGVTKITQPIEPSVAVNMDIKIDYPRSRMPVKLCLDMSDAASNKASSNGLETPHKVLFPIIF